MSARTHRDPKALAHAWEEIKARNLDEAEVIFAKAAEEDPTFADAWNGLGAVLFERGELEGSLANYRKAHDLALADADGTLPSRLSWNEADKPFLRSIHGIALNQFRMGKTAEAKKGFETLLRLNPDDNQGARFLLRDIDKKADLWKKDE